LKRLKEKVDGGADYVVTQIFFDNAKYFDFVAKAREIGITVPIIPGIIGGADICKFYRKFSGSIYPKI
jgi:5,10-methylenetetrahydrofolate reductase